jgi:hypothetical protein
MLDGIQNKVAFFPLFEQSALFLQIAGKCDVFVVRVGQIRRPVIAVGRRIRLYAQRHGRFARRACFAQAICYKRKCSKTNFQLVRDCN